MRRLIGALLAGLLFLGGGAYAMQALQVDGRQGGFTISVTPARQSAGPGDRVRYSVTVRRSGGFREPVRLRAQGLPRGARASWRRNDGTRSSLVPAGQDGAVMTVHTSRSTPAGSARPRVRAAGGGLERGKRFVLAIRPAARSFHLVTRPRRRVVAQGATTTYRIRVAGETRLRRRIRLRVRGLPAGTRAAWSPRSARARRRATLRIRVAPRAAPASARLIVTGRGRIRGRSIRRSTVVVLEIGRPLPFRIDGDLDQRLHPGASAPLDLALTNPHPFAIRLTRLTVAVEPQTSREHCSGTENFGVGQYAGPYPLTIPPGRTNLSALVADSALLPRVDMHNLPRNQDACKAAALTLRYDGTAVP